MKLSFLGSLGRKCRTGSVRATDAAGVTDPPSSRSATFLREAFHPDSRPNGRGVQ